MKISLIQITFIISLLGIITLLFISTFNPQKIFISEINKGKIYQKVNIQGKIIHEKIFQEHNFELIILKDSSNSTIDIIVDKPLNLTLNQEIQVIGEIIPYENSLQLNANKIISKGFIEMF